MIGLVLWALAGCSPDLFFVRTGGADLPVWVRGDGDTLIVVQHGSGSSGTLYDVFPAFDRLEERYALAYWDQRGAGNSQGNAAAATLTYQASVDDLALVVATLRERRDPDRLLLLGHSLGGGISQAFLLAHGDGIVGYVDVSGGRSLPEAYDAVRDEMIATADAFAGDPYWDAMRAFYQSTTDFPRGEPDRSTHRDYVARVLEERGYEDSAAEMSAFLGRAGVQQTFAGGFDVLAFLQTTGRFLSTFDLDGMDLSPDDVAPIDVPALVLAGRHDFSVPVQVSERTYDAFAADLPPSRLVVLESSGHFPMWDEPDLFADAVESFIDDLP